MIFRRTAAGTSIALAAAALLVSCLLTGCATGSRSSASDVPLGAPTSNPGCPPPSMGGGFYFSSDPAAATPPEPAALANTSAILSSYEIYGARVNDSSKPPAAITNRTILLQIVPNGAEAALPSDQMLTAASVKARLWRSAAASQCGAAVQVQSVEPLKNFSTSLTWAVSLAPNEAGPKSDTNGVYLDVTVPGRTLHLLAAFDDPDTIDMKTRTDSKHVIMERTNLFYDNQP